MNKNNNYCRLCYVRRYWVWLKCHSAGHWQWIREAIFFRNGKEKRWRRLFCRSLAVSQREVGEKNRCSHCIICIKIHPSIKYIRQSYVSRHVNRFSEMTIWSYIKLYKKMMINDLVMVFSCAKCGRKHEWRSVIAHASSIFTFMPIPRAHNALCIFVLGTDMANCWIIRPQSMRTPLLVNDVIFIFICNKSWVLILYHELIFRLKPRRKQSTTKHPSSALSMEFDGACCMLHFHSWKTRSIWHFYITCFGAQSRN